jgi:hypothetical protein
VPLLRRSVLVLIPDLQNATVKQPQLPSRLTLWRRINPRLRFITSQNISDLMPRTGTDWLGGIDDDLRNKLARCELVEPVGKRVTRSLILAGAHPRRGFLVLCKHDSTN